MYSVWYVFLVCVVVRVDRRFLFYIYLLEYCLGIGNKSVGGFDIGWLFINIYINKDKILVCKVKK